MDFHSVQTTVICAFELRYVWTFFSKYWAFILIISITFVAKDPFHMHYPSTRYSTWWLQVLSLNLRHTYCHFTQNMSHCFIIMYRVKNRHNILRGKFNTQYWLSYEEQCILNLGISKEYCFKMEHSLGWTILILVMY